MAYVRRLHDDRIEALIRSKRTGNYLLIGRAGSGKTSSLMAISDQLINSGMEHQLIPHRGGQQFVPPMARINLVDDLDIAATLGNVHQQLLDDLNNSASRSLNIITTARPEATKLRELLQISDEISIGDLSPVESERLYESFLARVDDGVAADQSFRDSVRAWIGQGRVTDPRALHLLAQSLSGDKRRLHYVSSVQESGLQIFVPKLITVQTSILRRISNRPGEIAKLSPIDFERLIGELFEKEGYSIEFTKKSRDGGVDIFAWKRDIAGESLTIVQCKKNNPNNPVRVGVVREVVGSMNIHSARAAAIFTTSYFTKPAADEATKIRYRLSLNDYFEIMQSISRHQADL
jgi:HJR/Mrr/RecB family endonuclease